MDAGSDAETPAAGLGYNLRVGTTPGGGEISAAMADASSGYRHVVALGNSQQRLSWSLDVSSFAPGTTLHWSVQAVDTGFAGSAFAPEEELVLETAVAVPGPPMGYTLYPNSPNPFNPSTTIRFDLPQAGTVELTIYDVAGRHVRSLVQEMRAAGPHQVIWRGRNDSGLQVGSGVYLYQLKAASHVETRRMTLLK